jgi:GTP-binding nuclear protein Ran
MSIHKIVLVGDGGVGKTTLLTKTMRNEYEYKYIATMGVDVRKIHFPIENMSYEIWDCAGQEQFGGHRDGYYRDTQGAIIMFDVTARTTFKSLQIWHKELRESCGDIPIIICGNKIDSKDRKVNDTDLKFLGDDKLSYLEISVKNDINIRQLFIHLSSLLNGGAPVLPPIQESKEPDNSQIYSRLEAIHKYGTDDISLELAMNIAKNEEIWIQWEEIKNNLQDGEFICVVEKEGKIKLLRCIIVEII